MTARDQEILRALLDALHDQDGHQLTDTLLHGQTNLVLEKRGLRVAGLAEFNAVLAMADSRGWVTGVAVKFGRGKKWNSNDAGESVRLELAQS